MARARPSRIDIAKPDIVKLFESSEQKMYWQGESQEWRKFPRNGVSCCCSQFPSSPMHLRFAPLRTVR